MLGVDDGEPADPAERLVLDVEGQRRADDARQATGHRPGASRGPGPAAAGRLTPTRGEPPREQAVDRAQGRVHRRTHQHQMRDASAGTDGCHRRSLRADGQPDEQIDGRPGPQPVPERLAIPAQVPRPTRQARRRKQLDIDPPPPDGIRGRLDVPTESRPGHDQYARHAGSMPHPGELEQTSTGPPSRRS